tara:strand:- start:3208 stop:3399 length:192 start_codon:yes stop_codon:yes gene_type:complete
MKVRRALKVKEASDQGFKIERFAIDWSKPGETLIGAWYRQFSHQYELEECGFNARVLFLEVRV